MHRAIRPRSPPERTFTFLSIASPEKRKLPRRSRALGRHGLGRFVFDSLYEGLFQVEAFLLVLGVVAEVYVVAFLDRALVVYLSEKATYESGLTLSVLADESYFVAAFHFEVYTAQNLFRFVFYFYFTPVVVYFAVGVVEGFAYVFGAEHYFSRRLSTWNFRFIAATSSVSTSISSVFSSRFIRLAAKAALVACSGNVRSAVWSV